MIALPPYASAELHECMPGNTVLFSLSRHFTQSTPLSRDDFHPPHTCCQTSPAWCPCAQCFYHLDSTDSRTIYYSYACHDAASSPESSSLDDASIFLVRTAPLTRVCALHAHQLSSYDSACSTSLSTTFSPLFKFALLCTFWMTASSAEWSATFGAQADQTCCLLYLYWTMPLQILCCHCHACDPLAANRECILQAAILIAWCICMHGPKTRHNDHLACSMQHTLERSLEKRVCERSCIRSPQTC